MAGSKPLVRQGGRTQQGNISIESVTGLSSALGSAWGRGFVNSADAAQGRTALGLGTAATRADDYFATAEQVGDISAALDAINGEVI